MSIAVTTSSAVNVDPQRYPGRRRTRKAERRRLARHDVLAVRRLELHNMRALLEDAIVMVNVGWIQGAWFAVRDAQGREVKLTAHRAHLAIDRPVSGVCLVGGIVQAAGGPLAVHTQLVQRTLDLTWHALHEDERQPVRWCPAPAIRSAHLRDLTRWNDHHRRTARQVSALLESAAGAANRHIELCCDQPYEVAGR